MRMATTVMLYITFLYYSILLSNFFISLVVFSEVHISWLIIDLFLSFFLSFKGYNSVGPQSGFSQGACSSCNDYLDGWRI